MRKWSSLIYWLHLLGKHVASCEILHTVTGITQKNRNNWTSSDILTVREGGNYDMYCSQPAGGYQDIWLNVFYSEWSNVPVNTSVVNVRSTSIMQFNAL